MNYILARLKEPSTYAGLSTLLLLGGIFSQENINQLLLILSAISGGLSITLKELPSDASNPNPSNPTV